MFLDLPSRQLQTGAFSLNGGEVDFGILILIPSYATLVSSCAWPSFVFFQMTEVTKSTLIGHLCVGHWVQALQQ